MVNHKTNKGVIAILTGGGDVPGLNPAIRAVTIRANREGYKVIGLRRGWAGIIELIRDKKADNTSCFQLLTDDIVNKAGRTGGTFLHTSRTRPSRPPHALECSLLTLTASCSTHVHALRCEQHGGAERESHLVKMRL